MNKIVKKALFSATLAGSLALAGGALAADTYAMDPGHTEVRFGWSHAGVSQQHAEFDKIVGTLKLDEANVENSSIEVKIDVSSLSSGFEALDTHLKSSDYLNVEKHPDISFKSTSIKKTGDKTADVTGDVTIHGVTLPVTLKAELTHLGEHPVGQFLDYYKGDWVAFKATTEIDHMAFKVGNFSTGPIAIEINTELKKQ
ncbi:MAG: YceI family protein [Pseudomonadota bacterium]